jgi:integrase
VFREAGVSFLSHFRGESPNLSESVAMSAMDTSSAAEQASGLDIRPHECRHSYITHLRAADVNDADLAEIVGHRVETMLARYVHAAGGGFEAIRCVIDRKAAA